MTRITTTKRSSTRKWSCNSGMGRRLNANCGDFPFLETGKTTALAGSHGKVSAYMHSGSHFLRTKSSDAWSKIKVPAVALGGQEGISFQLLKKGNKGKKWRLKALPTMSMLEKRLWTSGFGDPRESPC